MCVCVRVDTGTRPRARGHALPPGSLSVRRRSLGPSLFVPSSRMHTSETVSPGTASDLVVHQQARDYKIYLSAPRAPSFRINIPKKTLHVRLRCGFRLEAHFRRTCFQAEPDYTRLGQVTK